MHEHFHQLQYAQPGYFQAVAALGLSHGDQTGTWILNYPFPYTNASIGKEFAALRDQLLLTIRRARWKEVSLGGEALSGDAPRVLRAALSG